MYFLNPKSAWLLALLPMAVMLLLFHYRRQRQLLCSYGELRLIGEASLLIPGRIKLAEAGAFILAWLCLVLALMRPASDNGTVEFPAGTVDGIAVLDVSRSMGALDYKGQTGDNFSHGNRLDMARYLIATKMIPSLTANRLGIVTYSGYPFRQAFLSDDMTALKYVTEKAINTGSAPGEGSSIYSALSTAVQLYLVDSPPTNHRVLVLFSDGGNDEAANTELLSLVRKQLRQMQVEVIVVGLGSTRDSLIPVAELSPRDQAEAHDAKFYEFRGDVVKTKLDERGLSRLAERLGGTYVRVDSPSDFRLTSLVSGVEVKHRKGQAELFAVPLLLALLFALIAAACGARLYSPPNRRTGGHPR